MVNCFIYSALHCRYGGVKSASRQRVLFNLFAVDLFVGFSVSRSMAGFSRFQYRFSLRCGHRNRNPFLFSTSTFTTAAIFNIDFRFQHSHHVSIFAFASRFTPHASISTFLSASISTFFSTSASRFTFHCHFRLTPPFSLPLPFQFLLPLPSSTSISNSICAFGILPHVWSGSKNVQILCIVTHFESQKQVFYILDFCF